MRLDGGGAGRTGQRAGAVHAAAHAHSGSRVSGFSSPCLRRFCVCVQMVEALGGRGSEPALCVLLFTSANTVGRMAAGSVTERLLHRYGVPRCAPGAARPAVTQRHTQICMCPLGEQAPEACAERRAVFWQFTLLG